MRKNGICFRCESKEKPNHNCICKSWDVLLVDEDGLHDYAILIVYHVWWEKKETDTTETVDYDEKSASSNKIIKLVMDQEIESAKTVVQLVK